MAINFPLILGLAFLHLYGSRLSWLKAIPKRHWLSFSGGVAIAYVFIEILPSLPEAGDIIRQSQHSAIASLKLQVYLLALLGLIVFYGLKTLVVQSRSRSLTQRKETIIFGIHIGSFAVYNALFGYLLNHTSQMFSCLLLFGAVALHYIVNDYKLREHHREVYDRWGRWVLAGAVITGWAIGELMQVRGAIAAVESVEIAAVKAFLAGGVILNVLGGELPQYQESCFVSFLVGAAVYSPILLLAG